jgi:hypothetical protein
MPEKLFFSTLRIQRHKTNNYCAKAFRAHPTTVQCPPKSASCGPILPRASKTADSLAQPCKLRRPPKVPSADESTNMEWNLVSDEIEHYRLTEEIVLEFLKSEFKDCNLSDEDFNVHVCGAGRLSSPRFCFQDLYDDVRVTDSLH